MKSLYYLMSILLVGSISAAERNKSVYPDTIAPTINFELINKSPEPIALYVKKTNYHIITTNDTLESNNAEKLTQNFIAIKPRETFAANIDINTPTEVKIGSINRSTTGVKYPSNVKTYSIDAPKKTRYLSYDSSKKELEQLYPQTGPMKGLGKFTPNFILEDRTNSGLLKRNNVDLKDIALIKR